MYTPLKRKTPLCTLIGAFPGAVPPLIGWAAARGRLDPEAWVLYAMVFLWQFPHFMAIAWMYREDYSRAGYLVLPAGEQRNRFVITQSFVVSLVLVPISLIPTIFRRIGHHLFWRRCRSRIDLPLLQRTFCFSQIERRRRDNCLRRRLFIFL